MLLNQYLSGKASVYYMKYVAGKAKKWTLTMIFEGLFDYCFPRDFKSSLRRRLISATQGKTRVAEFIRDIEIMADRFPDVDERSIIGIFWWGMNQPIRAGIIEIGINQERSPLDKIVECAVRAEGEIREASAQRNRDLLGWGTFAHRNDEPRPNRWSNREGSSRRNGGREQVRANTVTPQQGESQQRASNRNREGNRKWFGRKISRPIWDELRADGKCFQCERPGHLQRACPQLNTIHLPTATVGNVDIVRLGRLFRARNGADLQVGMCRARHQQL